MSINVPFIIDTALFRIVQFGNLICLTTSMYFNGFGNDDSFDSYICYLGMTWWR